MILMVVTGLCIMVYTLYNLISGKEAIADQDEENSLNKASRFLLSFFI